VLLLIMERHAIAALIGRLVVRGDGRFDSIGRCEVLSE
jgi:hypothetical protein